MQYTIMCRVSGGSTGTHESRLRNPHGLVLFATREAAQVHADALNHSRNDNFHQRAAFEYWPAEHNPDSV